jgi:outer membrane assembly lipoprotein YfiO
LIRTYPGSELEAEAYFAMGNSFYREGGTENLLLAEDQYRNFIIFFPTNPKAPDAQMNIISILMSQMRSPDRDQKETLRAEAEIQKFLQLFPNNDFVPIVTQYLDEVRENLALSNLGVGDFYAHSGNHNGAANRYKEITELYPHFTKMDEVNLKLAESDLKLAEALKKLENPAAASAFESQAVEKLNAIVQGYSYGKYLDVAKAELTRLGKPIPAVDKELTAQHQALLKPSVPFSPLRPFIDLANAMGFIPVPNRYEMAKRTVAQTKAAAEAAALAAQQGSKPGDPEISLGTITKTADGKPVANAKVPPQQADKDKKDDSKVDPKKKKSDWP